MGLFMYKPVANEVNFFIFEAFLQRRRSSYRTVRMSLIKRLFAKAIHFTCLNTLIVDGELCFLGLINSCNFHQESQCSHFARTIFQTKYIYSRYKKEDSEFLFLCEFPLVLLNE